MSAIRATAGLPPVLIAASMAAPRSARLSDVAVRATLLASASALMARAVASRISACAFAISSCAAAFCICSISAAFCIRAMVSGSGLFGSASGSVMPVI